MIYSVFRWITGIALHWFYRDIRVVGISEIPVTGPVVIAVNHQNALVDSLIAAWVIPRRVTMTAKATLTDNPLIALLFRILNVVPLRRLSDEAEAGGVSIDRTRNAGAFREILGLLQRGGAVLIFPEGKSHNEAGLEPLKTGLARIALQGRDESHISGIQILPLGLVFEDKGSPGTVAGARFGKPIDLDSWKGDSRSALTEEIALRLRSVSVTAGLPVEIRVQNPPDHNSLRQSFITLAARWGRITHEYPVRLARNLAVRRSTNADEPAMLTILFGVGFVLASYAVHLTVLGLVAHSAAITGIYLAGLLCGAHWAAFERHSRRYYP
jgi:1-acyl-sn-glycerol-3-phosphate acyltransferase